MRIKSKPNYNEVAVFFKNNEAILLTFLKEKNSIASCRSNATLLEELFSAFYSAKIKYKTFPFGKIIDSQNMLIK